ncbi:MAG: 4Fe-4S dicluster domain-containing protein [bacterium]|nr:4Fe-4S dicluster domain-containing protein [bacterium]
METYFLPEERFFPFVLRLTEENDVFGQSKRHIRKFRLEAKEPPVFDGFRTVEPMKHFFMRAKEIVAKFGEPLDKEISPQVIIGARRCDLQALKVYDKVFLEGEVVDPFYKERREKTTIISVDCEEPTETCFCNIMGLEPWSDKDSDINFTPIKKGYIVDIITEKGNLLFGNSKDWLQTADENDLNQRAEKRRKATELLGKINSEYSNIKLEKALETENMKARKGEPMNCVECCACLMICPTCYCYLLYDEPTKEKMRVWDACYYPAYARVGGGANPRPDVMERFKNRFACKFEYSPKNHNLFACTGCGRCISGCMAKIDIKRVLSQLANAASQKEEI